MSTTYSDASLKDRPCDDKQVLYTRYAKTSGHLSFIKMYNVCIRSAGACEPTHLHQIVWCSWKSTCGPNPLTREITTTRNHQTKKKASDSIKSMGYAFVVHISIGFACQTDARIYLAYVADPDDHPDSSRPYMGTRCRILCVSWQISFRSHLAKHNTLPQEQLASLISAELF